MPTLSGPEYLNGQFSVAADGTVSLTTPPFSTAGGTISPGPVIISNAASPPQTTTQAPLLWLSGETATAALLDSYSNTLSPTVIARKARGTAAVPSAVQTGDFLLALNCFGRGATQYSTARAQIGASVLENWTDTAQGTQITLATSTIGTAVLRNRVYVTQGVVIGNPAPDPGQGGLILNANAAAPPQPPPQGTMLTIAGVDASTVNVLVDAYALNSSVTLRKSNGTAAAPSALMLSDNIGSLIASGYGATTYASAKAAVSFYTTQAWTDTANGSAIALRTTANGTTTLAEAMRIDHNGFVGIGTTGPAQRLVVSTPAGAAIAIAGFITPSMADNQQNYIGIGSAISSGNGFGFVYNHNATLASRYLGIQPFEQAPGAGLVITAALNVGIGTAAPGARLDVYGSAIAQTPIRVGYPGTTVFGRWYVDQNGTGLFTTAAQTGHGLFLNELLTQCTLRISGTERLTVDGSGGLTITGSNAIKPGGGSWAAPSSRELKSGVTPYSRGLLDVLALNPVAYNYNGKGGLPTDRRYAGLIAEEVEPVMPEIVGEMSIRTSSPHAEEHDYLAVQTIDPSDLVFALINAVKELNGQREEMVVRIAALESATVH